jgi:hypothetical protein
VHDRREDPRLRDPRAIVRELLAHGIPRRDIRHEITLDSTSRGGRADIVVILSGTVLAGIEIESAFDNLARWVEQLDAYARAFDAPLFVIDERLVKRLQRPDRQRVRDRAVSAGAHIWPTLTTASTRATLDGMRLRGSPDEVTSSPVRSSKV